MNHLLKIYFFLIDYRFIINIFISMLLLLYNFYTNSFILFMDDPNNSYINEEDLRYLPYPPGIVETSQGLRVELEADTNPNFVETNQGYRAEIDENNYSFTRRNISRISNPSHYPPFSDPAIAYDPVTIPDQNNAESTLLGTIHSDDPSEQIGIIEPTESQLNHNGIY